MCSARLEVNKPALTIWGFHVSSLVWTVDVGGALHKNNPMLVWAIDIPGTQHCLGSSAYTAERRKDVVIAVALIDLRAFKNGQILPVLHDDSSLIQNMFAIWRHAVQDERACADLRVNKVDLSIVVPEGTGVLKASLIDHRNWGAPRSGNSCRRADKNAFLRRREIDIEKPIAFPDRRAHTPPP